jgi:thioredoxin 1
MNKEDLKSGRILIDFYADWCGPCKMQGKQLEQYETEINEVKVLKVDIEVDHEMAQEFGVRSIPTLVYMVDGEVIDKVTGLQKINELKEFTKTK